MIFLVILCIFKAHLILISCDSDNNVTRELIPLAAPTNLTLQTYDANEAFVSWEPIAPETVRGTFRGYIVRIWNHVFSQVYAIQPNVTTTSVQFFPFSRNFVAVSVRNDKYVGPQSQVVSFDAPQTEPGTPYLFETNQLGSHSVLLRWSKPKYINGILLGYNIYCSEIFDNDINDKTTVKYFVPHVKYEDMLQAKLTGLKIDTKYQVAVAAVNCAGEGERNILEVEVIPHTPAPPTTASLQYKINYFDVDYEEYAKKECKKSRHLHPYKNGIKFNDYDEDDFYIFNNTKGSIVTDKSHGVKSENEATNKDPCLVKTLIKWLPDIDHNPGENFYLKYRIKGNKEYETTPIEHEEDFVVLKNFNACKSYELILIAVDDDFQTQSDIVVTPVVLFMYRKNF